MAKTDLKDKAIAITGASSGIGRATALACMHAGMTVAVMARREQPLRDLERHANEHRTRVLVFTGDVADDDTNARFIDTAETQLGPLHAVFANAGYGFEKPVLDCTDREIRDIFEVNFWGSLSVLRHAAARMKDRRAGHLLWCSSCVSKIGLPMYGPYCATKAAQDHLARAMRHELRDSGVHVSSVHPVGTKTSFFDEAAQRSGGKLTLMGGLNDVNAQTPETVARAVVRCLHKPRGEVWTSTSTRVALALATAFPGLTDAALAALIDARTRSPAGTP